MDVSSRSTGYAEGKLTAKDLGEAQIGVEERHRCPWSYSHASSSILSTVLYLLRVVVQPIVVGRGSESKQWGARAPGISAGVITAFSEIRAC